MPFFRNRPLAWRPSPRFCVGVCLALHHLLAFTLFFTDGILFSSLTGVSFIRRTFPVLVYLLGWMVWQIGSREEVTDRVVNPSLRTKFTAAVRLKLPQKAEKIKRVVPLCAFHS